MRKTTKSMMLIVGVMAAAIAAPSMAYAKCNSLTSVKFRANEHKARQAAILDVNIKFNSLRADAIASFGNAKSLTRHINRNVKIHPIELNCSRPGRYRCKAVKTWCF